MLPDGSACTVRAGTPCYLNGCLPARDWIPIMMQMALFRRWRSAFKAILTNSRAVRDILTENGIEGAEVLYYGIPAGQASFSMPETPTVAFAGRLVREKGVDILLRAFAKTAGKVPSARLLIAGDGPERERIKLLISELSLSSNVTLLGHLPNPEFDEDFNGAWVQVVPSLWHEPFGITAVEAAMRGTAVVASGSGGLREIVEDGKSGFLVPPGDVEALAEKLILLLKDKNLAESLGREGRESAESRFSEQVFLTKLLDIYERLYAVSE
jgi:glycosyltransferase involved in cell wall biosynthesis